MNTITFILLILLLNIILGCTLYYHEFKRITLADLITSIGGGIVMFIYTMLEEIIYEISLIGRKFDKIVLFEGRK